MPAWGKTLPGRLMSLASSVAIWMTSLFDHVVADNAAVIGYRRASLGLNLHPMQSKCEIICRSGDVSRHQFAHFRHHYSELQYRGRQTGSRLHNYISAPR